MLARLRPDDLPIRVAKLVEGRDVELGGGGAVAPDHFLVRRFRHARTVAGGTACRKGGNRLPGRDVSTDTTRKLEETHPMATRRSISVTLVLALAGVLLLLQSSFVAAKGGPTILEWQTMVGVPQAFTGHHEPGHDPRRAWRRHPVAARPRQGRALPQRAPRDQGPRARPRGGRERGEQPRRRVPRARQLPDRQATPVVVNVPTATSRPPPGRRARAAATPTSRPTSTCPTRASRRSSSSRAAAGRGSRRPAADRPLADCRRGRARARPRRSRTSRSHPRPRSRRPRLPRGGRGRRDRARGPGWRRTAAWRGRSAPATAPAPR